MCTQKSRIFFVCSQTHYEKNQCLYIIIKFVAYIIDLKFEHIEASEFTYVSNFTLDLSPQYTLTFGVITVGIME